MREKIGRYEITGELGKGAMGVVYKAIDPNIGRAVALKTMRVDVHGTDPQDLLKRLQNEAHAAGVLNHANIVTIYDAGEHDGTFYLAMEFIPGKTLAQLLAEARTVSAEQLVNIGTQICAGLDYAHTKGVIHRDIKPPNIMIAHDGTVKIMDFGIAKAGASLTHNGEVLGTPNYMSPEQVRGRDLDGRTDLFSMGVILYEMATGERPFNGQNVTAIIYKIIHEIPPAPRELDVTIHPGLSHIISKCLAKDPEERYQTGSDLSLALRSYKMISVPQPRTVTPITTHFASRPMQATMPSGLRSAAPARAASAAAPARATSGHEISAEALHPRAVKPASKLSLGVLGTAIVVVVVAVAGIVGLSKFSKAAKSSTKNNTSASWPNAAAPDRNARQATGGMRTAPLSEAVGNSSAVARTSETPPTAAAGVGELRITSHPPGAQVEIDGIAQDWYVTPFNAPPLKSGMHSVRAQLSGLAPQTRAVEVIASQKVVLDFQLAGDKAIYNIRSSPSGADIMIEGVASGRTTPAELNLTPGPHHVVLRMDGFAPVEVTAEGAAGQLINISPVLRARNSVVSQQTAQEPVALGRAVKLRRLVAERDIPEGMGALQVRTRPRGVTVVVDNKPVLKVTPVRFPIRPGTHSMVLQKDGFQSVTRTVQVDEGRMMQINEILLPQR